ncbi:hypothetical protein CVT25_010417 [Psilocybe cyanescens]|uniref:Uncharacterized protein n=1 Tax=Psilocybe cyanescens TaxID=93625 RepID=A0A409X2N8_PSICY|nr:hypothetical protein CVT25_010417 [Psilocybe cyanescens]
MELTILEKWPPLLSLALSELIQAISDELNLSNVKKVRLTYTVMVELLRDQVLRTLITLGVSRLNISKGVHKIETHSMATHAVCRAARVLTTGSLSPAYDPTHRPASRYEQESLAIDLPPKNPPGKRS